MKTSLVIALIIFAFMVATLFGWLILEVAVIFGATVEITFLNAFLVGIALNILTSLISK